MKTDPKPTHTINSTYSVFDNMIEGVQVLSEKLEYIYVNDSVVNQSKNKREDLLGKTVLDHYPGFEETKAFKKFKKCIKKRVSDSMINKFEFPDGSASWFDLKIHPVKDGILVFTIDISEQKKLESELFKINELLESRVTERNKEVLGALERQRKLSQSKREFVLMASHEFKTPLSGILSSLSLAERYFEAEQYDKCDKHFQRIKSSVYNMTGKLNDYLSLDQLERGNVSFVDEEVFQINEFLNNVVNQFNGILKNQQKIIYSHIGNTEVFLKKKTLRNVIYNLLSNSIKYSEKNIELESKVTPKEINIVVKDHGVGMPLKQQEYLFYKLFRDANTNTKDESGLGMNIVKQYIDSMNGKINFESEENKGTTFFLDFPLKRLVSE